MRLLIFIAALMHLCHIFYKNLRWDEKKLLYFTEMMKSKSKQKHIFCTSCKSWEQTDEIWMALSFPNDILYLTKINFNNI